MITEITGIEYEIQGQRLLLYPEKDKHTETQIQDAIKEVRITNTIISIQIRWKKLNDKTPNPEKISDEFIIKHLQQKVGELESYIDELKEVHKKDLQEEKKVLKKEIQSEELYNQMKKDNSKLKKENTNLKQSISQLITNQRHNK